MDNCFELGSAYSVASKLSCPRSQQTSIILLLVVALVVLVDTIVAAEQKHSKQTCHRYAVSIRRET